MKIVPIDDVPEFGEAKTQSNMMLRILIGRTRKEDIFSMTHLETLFSQTLNEERLFCYSDLKLSYTTEYCTLHQLPGPQGGVVTDKRH